MLALGCPDEKHSVRLSAVMRLSIRFTFRARIELDSGTDLSNVRCLCRLARNAAQEVFSDEGDLVAADHGPRSGVQGSA